MGFLDLLLDFLGLKPDTWQDRLAGFIYLTSPDGDKFTAFWRGGTRSVSKKLGIFEFPGIDGSKVQDLGGGGVRYPLTIYFAGSANDKEADSFFAACSQVGNWEVEHPSKGPLTLQWISYTEHIEPVTSGNITRFEIESIVPLPDSATVSTAQIGSGIGDLSDICNASSTAQFALNTLQDTFAQFTELTGTIGKGISAVKTILRAAENFQLVPVQAAAILRGITTTIESFPLDTSQLSGQVQNLVQLYAEAQNSVSDSLDMFTSFVTEIGKIEPSAADDEGLNVATVKELFMSAAIVGIAQASRIGGEKTRAESIENAETVSGLFSDITDNLDLIQVLYEGSPIELQYFSQSQSYADALVISAEAAKLLLLTSFDLSTEKRFTLDRERNAIPITVEEYGSLGENEENLDLFLESNDVSGAGFFILPAGLEVVVYG
jgi:hypothetical protein